MATSRIVELGAIIATNTRHLDAYCAKEGFPSPSFDPDGPTALLLNSEVTSYRQAILDATDELHALMQDPIDHFRHPFSSLISVQAIARFDLASSFPPGTDTTFAEIAKTSGLPEVHVRRLLRHAMAFRIFQEPSEGVVQHTPASKLLAETPLLRQYVAMVSGEVWPAATKTVEALARWPGSEEPNNAGYNIANNTDGTIFDDIAHDPDRSQRYADAMTYIANGRGLEHHHIVNGYDWAALGDGKVVDVGGSHGSLCIAVAQAFPSLRWVVQDRPEVIALGQANLPPDVRGRVDFMAHDFFQEQPIKDANIYILRWILHDWSDAYAARVVRQLIPALRLGAKLLVLEQVLPAPGEVSTYQEKSYRTLDFAMWALHNAKERDLADWKELLRLVNPGCELRSVTQPQGSRLSILEIGWGSGE